MRKLMYYSEVSYHTDKDIERFVVKNICMLPSGLLVPGRGHKGNCRWSFDGSLWYHLTKHNQFDSIKVSERMNTNG